MVEFGKAWEVENLALLSEVIGVPLELREQEEKTADDLAVIVARIPISDNPNENLVVIVNQLGQSDLAQLGQILTYLSVRPANTAIWITEEFAQTHQQAIRWLNEKTPDDFDFFAVKIEATQNGDSSLVASAFNIVEQPANWEPRSQAIQAVTRGHKEGLKENYAWCRAFWQQYAQKYPEELIGHAPNFRTTNLYHKIIDGVCVCQVFFDRNEMVGVYLSANKRYASARTTEFSEVLRRELVLNWETKAGGIAKGGDTRNPANWPEMIDWLHDRLEDFRRVILAHARETGLIE